MVQERCDPRKNAFMREGNQSDKVDARGLVGDLGLERRNSHTQKIDKPT
jgi:hypothetical protein